MQIDAITRPAARYFGGKWRLGAWIVSFFPPHESYLEPCGGVASVLLQKPRCKAETFNDLSGDVCNFFRVLRDREKELIRAIGLTPWAREEYQLHHEPTDDPVERARRFWVGCSMSIGGLPFTTSGWRTVTQTMPGQIMAMTDLTADYLYPIARRLKGVQIENLDALEVIQRYDREGGLIYYDPPYTKDTRSSGYVYTIEKDDPERTKKEHIHIEAAELLHTCKSMVVVSGYNCPLYEEIYGDWKRVDKKSQANAGQSRVESLWLSWDWEPEQLVLF